MGLQEVIQGVFQFRAVAPEGIGKAGVRPKYDVLADLPRLGHPDQPQEQEDDGHRNTDGWIDVLVGLDGTDDAVESTRHVIATLASATRRVRLAAVLDHEVSGSAEVFEADDRRIAYLETAARSLGMPDAEIAVLSGQPDKALADHATEHNFDMLVVAHRRDTLLSGIRGSTVGRLARNAALPILIGPPVA